MTTRDLVGIVLFLAALTVAASFMFGNPSGTNGAEPTISLGIEPSTPTPTAEPTAEPTPITAIGAPGESWLVTFFAIEDGGERSDRATNAMNVIDFEFDGAPFGDTEDDAWGLVAETTISLPEGRYRITLEAQAEVQVSLYGSPVAARGWSPQPEQFQIDFDHPGGRLPIVIDAVDAEGAFRLAWR